MKEANNQKTSKLTRMLACLLCVIVVFSVYAAYPKVPKAYAADLIMDNSDSSGISQIGTWTGSTAAAGYYGSNSVHDGNTGKGTKSFTFTPNFTATGEYQVYMWWNTNANRADNVPVDIIHQGTTDTVIVNQKLNGGAWNLLGTYSFDAGTSNTITIRTTGTNGYVIADAIKLVASGSPTSTPTPTPTTSPSPTPTSTPPPANGEIIIDSTDTTGITKLGNWVIAAGAGSYNNNYLSDNNTNKGSLSISYTPNIPTSGSYAVYVRWPYFATTPASQSTKTPIVINYNGGSKDNLLNQRNKGSDWVYLGSFPFAAGTSGNVTIRNEETDGRVNVDAVKFVPVSSISTTPVNVTNPVALPATSDEFDILRNRRADFVTGWTSFNPTDTILSNKLYQINAKAQQLWDTMNKDSARNEIWMANSYDGNSWGLTATYQDLLTMAIAYLSPYTSHGFNLAGNTQLKDDIIAGMDWIYYRDPSLAVSYNENSQWRVNWWDYEIGAPLYLNDLMALLYQNLTTTQITNYTNAIERFSPNPTKFYYNAKLNPTGGNTATGANRIWKANVVAFRGIIVKDSDKIAASRDALSQVLQYVQSGDGFYTDGSFIQHGKFSYAAGYGNDIISSLSDLMTVLNGSTWQVTDTNKNNVFKWIYDSFEPVVYKGDALATTIARSTGVEKAQDHVMGHGVINAIAKVIPYSSASDALAYKRMIKQWLQEDTVYGLNIYKTYNVYVASLLRSIMNDTTIAPRGELVESYVFPSMDRVIHLRPGFGFSVGMTSTRIGNYESINNVNKQGWYTGFGATYLYNGDLKKYSDDYMATVNRYRIPGTTVDTQIRYDGQAQGQNSTTDWVGGSELDNTYSITGMELGPYNVAASGSIPAYVSNLTGKKSWFMFDNEIVNLGAGISSSIGQSVETTIENAKLTDAADNTLTVGGVVKSSALGWNETMSGTSYIHLTGNATGSDIGYYFPTTETVKGLRESRTSSWQAMDSKAGSTLYTRNFLNLWIDHGMDPSNQSYAYVTLPNKSASQTAVYAANPDVTILENSSSAQGVKETSLNITGINFWNDITKTVGGITSNKKASVMVKETATQIEVVVSDPTQKNTGSIQIDLNQSVASVSSKDTEITVSQLNTVKMIVNVSGSKGKSFKIVFNK
ncbi:polysaccharide lyase family 8 super-sandwich domain-containing protein [Paenibacillus roseipurpureus]|uniref:Polysaccharide lyase family 8 super-sandwich domain-containing protein n=1 Tax=Paenibacillus roseopurpureus TaxID=2918901 RepID=A0AA96LNA5_9BACL|nr:polysaccharide lyase family 8 super-sandwich domain-containing protein [Paenibacillus sp. MBLB1832]WNR42868.1 polysaccharide lyase family 8 super-sandwich domain-containing protein [Paenibacillus sp. MBLB1832]